MMIEILRISDRGRTLTFLNDGRRLVRAVTPFPTKPQVQRYGRIKKPYRASPLSDYYCVMRHKLSGIDRNAGRKRFKRYTRDTIRSLAT